MTKTELVETTNLKQAFDVDPATGFLPSPDPITRLPDEFAAWDALGAELPALLLARRARARLAAMPRLDAAGLHGKDELERAMLLLSTFANAYVGAEPVPALRIPAALAVPLCAVTERLGRKPIISHASNALYNWRRLDAAGGIDLDNLAIVQPFLGGSDEAWFVLVTVAIEARGAAALPDLVRAQAAVARGDAHEARHALERIAAVIEVMTATLQRMYERCDPHVFYHRVRPFLAAWPAPGMIYEGVSEAPVVYAGGSAGQSSLVQALDAALGVRHTSAHSSPFLREMRGYMPPPHRAFVEALEAGPDVGAFARTAGAPDLIAAYDACIGTLAEFRTAHMEIAVRYITMQSPDRAARGTGGSDFALLLGAARRETRESRVSTKEHEGARKSVQVMGGQARSA